MSTALIATIETDAELRQKCREEGYIALLNNKQETDCPWDGLMKQWWLEGYQGNLGPATAQ